VVLFFAERLYDEIGERVFNVYVQNQKLPFRRNYDILARTGDTETTTTETGVFGVVDGFLRIYLERVTGEPIICGIQVVPV
jgi:Malectin domain